MYEHWRRTGDVFYLRRNFDRFMSIQPLTKEQYESLKSGDVDGFVFPKIIVRTDSFWMTLVAEGILPQDLDQL